MGAAIKTCDYDLRHAVVTALLGAGFTRDAIRHEITLDSSSSDGRADVVIADDAALFGIEIKSGKDKLTRLPDQGARYRRRFDHLTLVIDKKHEAAEVFGENCEFNADIGAFNSVIVYDGGVLRGVKNWHWRNESKAPWSRGGYRQTLAGQSGSLSPHAMLCLLWQAEVSQIGEELFPGKIPSARCRAIPRLSEMASLSQLRPLVADALRMRGLNRWEEAFWRDFDSETVEGAVA
jgi:hypothetical protein